MADRLIGGMGLVAKALRSSEQQTNANKLLIAGWIRQGSREMQKEPKK